MNALKYKIIKTEEQYYEYCILLEELRELRTNGDNTKDEIELLTFLIEKWDADHSMLVDADPIELLKSLMNEKN